MEQVSAALVDARVVLPRSRVRVGRSVRAAVAFDEDVVTLGTAAAQALLDDHPRAVPAAIILATVSPPLLEGGSAAVVAEVLGLDDVLVQEHGGTIACGGDALVASMGLVRAGVAPVLYLAGDTRRDPRGQPYGDCAVAALLDGGEPERVVGRVTWQRSSAGLFRDTWRRPDDMRVTEADRSLLAHRPTGSSGGEAGGASNEPAVSVDAAGPVVERAGALGSAGLLVGVLQALGTGGTRPELTATVSAGGVTHTFSVTAGAGAERCAALLEACLAGGADGPPPESPSVDAFEPYTSQPRAWRERGMELRLEALKDPGTGEVLFPPPPRSDATRTMEPFRLARRGHVYTRTRDHVFPYGAPLTMAVVELDGGGRFYGQVAAGLDVAIGQPVGLVLRRLHSAGGIPQYYWKVVPAEELPAAATPGRS